MLKAHPEAVLHNEFRYDLRTKAIVSHLVLPTPCGGWFIEYRVDARGFTSFLHMWRKPEIVNESAVLDGKPQDDDNESYETHLKASELEQIISDMLEQRKE